ncbi:MAG: hypothetical protein WD871_01800 [Xanthobacteraceae bacterium]
MAKETKVERKARERAEAEAATRAAAEQGERAGAEASGDDAEQAAPENENPAPAEVHVQAEQELMPETQAAAETMAKSAADAIRGEGAASAAKEPQPPAGPSGPIDPVELYESAPADAVMTVTARKPRRRGGRAFGPSPTEIRVRDLTAEQFAAIWNDPALKCVPKVATA